MENRLFEAFNQGRFLGPGRTVDFGNIPWSKHPTFEGVELKHILTSAETGGAYSYHLVRIAPGKSILYALNDGVKIQYEPGVISVMLAKVHHEVHAGDEGLYLFAKFMPALC